MFRLYRTTICSRWHSNYKSSFEKKSENVKPKTSVLCIKSEEQNHSNDSHNRQHANKQEQRYWDDPHFHFNFVNASLFETASWLGTVAVCFNFHFKFINNVIEYENERSCLFSNIVRALPRRHIKNETTQISSFPSVLIENTKSDLSVPSSTVPTVNKDTHLVVSDSDSPKTCSYSLDKDKVLEDADILGESIKVLSEKYAINIRNSIGLNNINKNDKKAFRSFQNAARHGCTAGLYNLGLCYQLGKGTKVNLNMAAYCYRKAAMKGHGLASFNLAVFFHKGIGGLPVDTKIAKELLAEAAEKDVSEAQLYFGILFLEEKKWSDAVRILSDLARKNIPDAQYYLGLCYENGLGVQRNEVLAFDLFKKSAEQGSKKAASKLASCKKVYNDNSHSFPKTDEYKVTENNYLHPSMSVPELRTIAKKSNQSLLKFPMLSYLDLFTSVLIVNNTTKIRDSFYSSNKFPEEYSNTYLSFKPLPAIMDKSHL